MATLRKIAKGRIRAVIRLAPNDPHWQIFENEEDAMEWVRVRESQIANEEARRQATEQARVEHEQLIRNQALVQKFVAHVEARTTPTLAEALERYEYRETAGKRGHRAEARRIVHWKRHELAGRPLDAIRGLDLANYRDSRLDQGMAGNTIRLELALISHLYNVARTDWGFDWLHNPGKAVRKPKVSRGRQRRMSLEEEAKLLDYCDQMGLYWLRAVIMIAVETAMRRGEFAGLEWGAVDLRKRLVYLDETKNGDSRTVPLSTRAVKAFELLKQTDCPVSSEPIFPVHRDNISQGFKAACVACEIADMRLHDLRHEGTSRLFEKRFESPRVSSWQVGLS